MSPSSDRIAVCAWRCVRLLATWRVRDLLGGDDVVEAYPAGALRIWGLPHRGYKTRSAATAESAMNAREALVDALLACCPWLQVGSEDRALCIREADVLDALVCALVGRAAERGRTIPPPAPLDPAIEREGWIHLPADADPGGLAA